jgi:hypothetical protein
MAEVTGLRNNGLPYPVYGAPFGIVYPMLDADGDFVSAATTPDAEVSKNGDTFADCTNESTEIATNSGLYYLLLTGTEMTADVVAVIAKSATAGMKTTPIVLYPRKLPTVRSGTSQAGAAGTITLDASASAVDDYYNGMLCIATIDSNVEARIISDYVGSTKVASVVPDWNVVPDSDDTFIIKLPEGVHLHPADVTHFGSVALTSASGIPEVKVNNIAANAITATAINADAITAAKIADGAIDAATFAANAITSTVIANDAITDAKVAADVTIASVTGAVGSVTGAVGSVTGAVGSVAAGGITAASFAANAITAAKLDPDVTTELQAGLATQASVDAVAAFLDTEIAAILAAVDTEVAAILAAVDTEIAAIKAKTDSLTFTKALELDVNMQSINGTTVNGDGAGTPWGP